MTFQNIALSVDRQIATLTLKRPDKMNAIDQETLLEIQQAMSELEKDTSVRALIITGEGRAFSSGFDLSPRDVPIETVGAWRDYIRLGNDTWLRIWRSRLPVIAAVNGYCLGGGCELSMVCDLTLAADCAEFGEPEIQFSSAPPFAIMPWVLGMKKTKELLLTGQRINAVEAERIGLVNRVVSLNDLMTEARKLALKLAMIPPPAMALNKAALNQAYDLRGFQSAVDYGVEMFTLVHMSETDEAREFYQVAAEKGLKAAFKWRDLRFADEKEKGAL
ncbi:enoyl-CoA hydratase/isomerase family protein [Caballeronia sp. SBC2]|uniref:enoyl-CoA hydratase/isomerase family protein n=1 Tax=Caballeronia sp. SBC2 TaxID=2705547 RepID=UPI0013E17518|nr:enoyl-CoA hydratase/isomerase family protein [Caballeronia sp. SBC2]QIE30474.1 1,4-dihydroxy-2-naphthoyl-CoA synthase [Caballeronia sp. SBC2]